MNICEISDNMFFLFYALENLCLTVYSERKGERFQCSNLDHGNKVFSNTNIISIRKPS